MVDRRGIRGLARGCILATLGTSLIACATPDARGTALAASRLSELRSVTPPVASLLARDLDFDVAFDASHCPSQVAVTSGEACDSGVPNCGKAFRQKKVTFKGPEAFTVFFDPSQAPIQANSSGGAAFEASIIVHPSAIRGVEYKFSVISSACSGQYFDPIIIVEN